MAVNELDRNTRRPDWSTISNDPAFMTGSSIPSQNEYFTSQNWAENHQPTGKGSLNSITRDPSLTVPFNPTSFIGQSLYSGRFLLFGCLYLLACVATAGWMLASGPQPVPKQDTRITNAIISIVSRVALTISIWILTVLLRIQWTRILVSRRLMKLRGLILACGNMGMLGQMRYLHLMPIQVGITMVIGVGVTICMTLTSAGFQYIVKPNTGMVPFTGPDLPALCNYSLVNDTTGYFCGGNTNDVQIQWNYFDAVNGGAGGNVVKNITPDGRLTANVTLTSAPANIRLPSNPPPPWAAIDVGCKSVDLELQLVGTGTLANTTVLLHGVVMDVLSVANMPTWNSEVMIYQQANDSGPASSLAPYYTVLLARDVEDDIQGLAKSALKYLGNFYLDLHGYGPISQRVLGAAAYCDFGGSTGGDWPDVSWPARNTKNYFVGDGPKNGTLGVATLFLNYGPGWQYTPTLGNSIPGGTVTFIANLTTEALTFPDFFAAYMRNQWALMMYANNFIKPSKNTTYEVLTDPFIHIQATAILAIPLAALVFCVGCAASGFWMMASLGAWYERVDNSPWWLMKAVNATPGLGAGEVDEAEFQRWAEQKQCWYGVDSRDTEQRAVLRLQ